jgi:hypothetical protein
MPFWWIKLNGQEQGRNVVVLGSLAKCGAISLDAHPFIREFWVKNGDNNKITLSGVDHLQLSPSARQG